MTFFNKIYSSSTERIITRSSSNNDFDIELQHPQPRRRQIFDHVEDNHDKPHYHARAYSVPSKQRDTVVSERNRLPSINNILSIPANLSSLRPPDPFIMSSPSTIHEEKHLTIMARSLLSALILILLPLTLLSGIIFRYSVISIIYGFFLLIIPWLGTINERNLRIRFRLLVFLIGLISLLTIIAQLIFQSILLANKPYGHTLANCAQVTRILRYFGLERLDNSDAVRILRLIFPDIIILAVATICYVIIRRTLLASRQRLTSEFQTSTTSNGTNASPSSDSSSDARRRSSIWPRLLSVIRRIRLFLQFVLVGFAAFAYPSLINSTYFLFFLIMALVWSLSIKFGRKFALARALLVIYTGLHLSAFYLYQFTFFQEAFQPFSTWSNITGLTAIVINNCTAKEPYLVTNLAWSDYVNPCALLLLYLFFAFETNQTLFERSVRSSETTMQSVEQQMNSRRSIDKQSLVHAAERRDTSNLNTSDLLYRRSLEQPEDRTWQGRIIFVIYSILRVLERQSYLLSIIAMLAWSITYHSLLTLVFLLWACLLWVLPNSRKWCLRMSPFFTLYGAILLVLQYLCGFKISYDQLNLAYDRRTMAQIGIEIKDYQPAFLYLVVKSFYMMSFWVTFRQYINERGNATVGSIEVQSLTNQSDSYPRRLGRWIIGFFTKYWIFVSCGMLLLVSIQNTVVIYRIIYMAFYLFFILSFQISFGFWRKTVSTFHLTIIIYSMIILIGIYVYQFEKVHGYLQEKLSPELLASIGLEVVESNVLAGKLLTPSAFLVVNIMQLYYFHSGWMDLITMPSEKDIQGAANATLKEIHAYARENTTDPNSAHTQRTLNSEPQTWQASLYKFYFRANRIFKQITYYAWRFAEIHSYKLVLLVMILVSVLKVCAFNVTLIILATIGLVLLRLRPLINLLTLIATGLYILASMCYQLKVAEQQIVRKNIFVKNCSQIYDNATLNPNVYAIPNDTAKWFGLELTTHIDRFIGLHILLTVALTFNAIARYRQRHRCSTLAVYFNAHLVPNRFPILFEPFALKNVYDETYEYDMVSYQQADQGVIYFLKYLSNFMFYRFGLEICYITTVIVIGVRLDVMAVLYSIWLGLFLISSRRTVQRMWPVYILFHIIAFPVQYLSAVGAPPFLCFVYPWTDLNFNGRSELKTWLFLPDYVTSPLATQLIADFFQFLFLCQQWRVFSYETNDKHNAYAEAGGSNREIIYDDDVYRNNPTWDFVTTKRHWLDYIKYGIFMYGVWSVLSIVYLAGTTRISLLGLGYLIACFYFLWYGQDFLTKQVTVMLRLWNYLIYYCFAAVFIKACLQVVVCIYLYPSTSSSTPISRTSLFCTVVDLFVPCLKSSLKPANDYLASHKGTNEQCNRSAADASLFMDGFCMAFLLLQKRIFGSYYWEHIVTELRSQAKLASQGAVLFNQITRQRIEEDREREEQTVMKITRSLKRIKEQQLKLNQTDTKGPSSLVDTAEHCEAIRSGDYYMFDYESDEEEDEVKDDTATVAQEQILQVITANGKDAAEAVAEDKPPTPSHMESNKSEFTPASPFTHPQPATTSTSSLIPPLPTLRQTTSDVPAAVETKKQKRQSIINKIRLIGRIATEYLIDLFNRNSRDFREVSRQLSEMKSNDKIIQHERIRAETSALTALAIDIDPVSAVNQRNGHDQIRGSSEPVDATERSRLYRFFDSAFYFVMSRSELLCYSAMIINHLTSGALLSLPLPLSIFLWATLSSRPSRNYWITVLTYTEAMIVVEYIFQFRFYPWNAGTPDTRPLAAINIIGINRRENAASAADLFLLLTLFLHRSILKQLGLWKADHLTPQTSTVADVDQGEQQQQPQHKEIPNQVESTRIKRNSYFMKPIIRFYRQLKQALFVRDVYAPMFFCDFINMIIVIGFYSQFGLTKSYTERTGGNVVQTIKENKVPVAFLVILLVQFILIIIDRALYLRRNVRGKLFFQLFQVIVVHIWLFFVLPGITRIKFRDNTAAQFWYIFKCIYFGYSSIQVRLGYPKRIAGNFLMKRFNYVNQVLYRIYLLIPFLLELRTIMDWMFTDTALGLTSWLQLEDIYSNVYLLKCGRWAEKKYPTERGVSRPKLSKYGVGGSLLALLILLIWFPLLFFSFTSSFYQPNPPKEVNVEIKLGGYLPIYEMTAQAGDLAVFNEADYNSLRASIYSPDIESTVEDTAYAFLRDFNPNDIYCVNLFATSANLWDISQPIRDIVVNNLQSNESVPVRFSYTITRNPPTEDDSEDIAAIVTDENTVFITSEDQDTRNSLIDILNGTLDSQTMARFTIDSLLPRFLHVKPKAKPDTIDAFKKIFPREYYANITMGLARSVPNSTRVWWEMSENRTGFKVLPSCLPANQNYLSMIFFNDKVSPANISFLTRYGIIGLYTTFVVVVARLLRTILQTSQTIMFNELPSVDRVWHLLRDIYLVREHSSLRIEEQLFAKLVFLYRSPETLIRFTRPKQE